MRDAAASLDVANVAVVADHASTARTRSAWPNEPGTDAAGRPSTARVYGQTITKTYKTFLATYPPAGGVIRVVMVKEDHGWHRLLLHRPDGQRPRDPRSVRRPRDDRARLSRRQGSLGNRQQQVRNIWTNLAVYNLNLWMHTLVELWAWDKQHDELCDRADSPWDDAERRPSHANRRKALRQQIMRTRIIHVNAAWQLPRKIIDSPNAS